MLSVTPIEAFADNYIWCLQRGTDRGVFVVDPGDGAPVLKALQARRLELAGILITHHHYDHTGGLEQLLAQRQVPVYGPRNPAIARLTVRLAAGDRIEVLGRTLEVLEVPGHTLDHIAYFSAGEPPLLFCGDTLFAGGCGRLFEGDPPVMHRSLSALAALPASTLVYCAHEYTLANLAFALAVEPDNAALNTRRAEDQARRQRNLPTVPSELGLELATNPFLRCRQAAVCAAAQARDSGVETDDPVAVFAALRRWKDQF